MYALFRSSFNRLARAVAALPARLSAAADYALGMYLLQQPVAIGLKLLLAKPGSWLPWAQKPWKAWPYLEHDWLLLVLLIVDAVAAVAIHHCVQKPANRAAGVWIKRYG